MENLDEAIEKNDCHEQSPGSERNERTEEKWNQKAAIAQGQ